MYSTMFKVVFDLFQGNFGLEIKWSHIHGDGLYGITVDQDYAAIIGKNCFTIRSRPFPNRFRMDSQLIGFSTYLSLHIDPLRRPWIYHATRAIRLCHVHFQRGVEKLTRSDQSPDSLWSRMMQLLSCRSEGDYLALCAVLESTNSFPIDSKLIQVFITNYSEST